MAAIKTREIHYTAPDGSALIGYFAAPETDAPLAGVLVAPECTLIFDVELLEIMK